MGLDDLALAFRKGSDKHTLYSSFIIQVQLEIIGALRHKFWDELREPLLSTPLLPKSTSRLTFGCCCVLITSVFTITLTVCRFPVVNLAEWLQLELQMLSHRCCCILISNMPVRAGSPVRECLSKTYPHNLKIPSKDLPITNTIAKSDSSTTTTTTTSQSTNRSSRTSSSDTGHLLRALLL